jgi:hypothetical protein
MAKRAIDIDESTYSPGFLPGGHSTFNRYATKKTLANSSIEIALLVTNAVQLKTLLGGKIHHDVLWYVGLTLVCISLFIQIINACILVLLGKDDISKEQKQQRLVSLNNFSLILSVLLAIVNVVLNVIVVVEPQILIPTINGTKYA